MQVTVECRQLPETTKCHIANDVGILNNICGGSPGYRYYSKTKYESLAYSMHQAKGNWT